MGITDWVCVGLFVVLAGIVIREMRQTDTEPLGSAEHALCMAVIGVLMLIDRIFGHPFWWLLFFGLVLLGGGIGAIFVLIERANNTPHGINSSTR